MARRQLGNKRIRIRAKRLDQLDETKLALALWLLAKDTLTPELPAAPVLPSAAHRETDDGETA